MASSVGRQAFNNLKLAVLRLPWTVGTKELKDHFSQFGPLRYCRVIFDTKTGFSKGYGFVRYANAESYDQALTTQHKIDDELVIVQETSNDNATPRRPRRPDLSRHLGNVIENI